MDFWLAIATLGVALPLVAAAPEYSRPCRSLPGDRDWPSIKEWNALNSSVGGKLIQGAPIAHVCYGPNADATACGQLRNDWALVDPFLNQPVSVVSPFFDNSSCSPFISSQPTYPNPSQCRLGNLAVYAINVSDARAVAAGVNFARTKNLRLIVKNTGHDVNGGSSGTGSLSLWTHYLRDISLIKKYSSPSYSGPAFKIGAGVQFRELQAAANANGLRVVGGSCPTVGANGGWRQGGGHGPLASAHGLGADNSLEYEVVTASGEHTTASPTHNSDLFYALSGGGAGNYAVVVSAIVKAHPDGQIAGSRLTITNNNPAYWTAVKEWMKHLLVLDKIPGFSSEVLITQQSFALVLATLPGGTQQSMQQALAPFYQTLNKLNITPTLNETKVQASYVDHYAEYLGGVVFTRNITISCRLIPRTLIPDNNRLAKLTTLFEKIVSDADTVIYLLGYNVTSKAHNVPKGYNAVTPAWRDSLFLANIVVAGSPNETWPGLRDDLARVNVWQDQLRELTPGGGSYINEGTYNTPYFKEDYFGGTYDRLRAIKQKYDPGHVFYTRPGVGSDEYLERPDGHLCKV